MAADDLREALVFGRSHTRAVWRAWKARAEAGRTEGVELRFMNLRRDEWQPNLVDGSFSEKILAEFARSRLRLIVSVIGGNDHNYLGIFNRPFRFDFGSPEAPGLPQQQDADGAPSLCVRTELESRLRPTLDLIRLLRRSTSLPIVQLESPPPIPSAEHIEKYPVGFEEAIPLYGVAAASLRYKLWRVHSEIVRETCEALRIRFVPVPRTMQDPDGMLIPEAWANDATHGNAFYGERLCRQILAIVARRRVLNA